MASASAALVIAPACTVSSGSGDNEAGAGGEGNSATTGGKTSTGGTTSGGGADGEGGTTGEAGASSGGSAGAPSGGAPSGGATGDAGSSGAGGAEGGASGKVCTNPTTAEVSAKGDTCARYCASYLSTCAAYNTSDGTFDDEAACLSTCELFDDAQLCCRAYHVRNAAPSTAAATTHCPHAAGNAICN